MKLSRATERARVYIPDYAGCWENADPFVVHAASIRRRCRCRGFPGRRRLRLVACGVMQLTPVSRRTPLALDDRSAKRPADLPDDDVLKEKTRDLLKQLGELQATLYADARYALLVVLQARDAGGKDG